LLRAAESGNKKAAEEILPWPETAQAAAK